MRDLTSDPRAEAQRQRQREEILRLWQESAPATNDRKREQPRETKERLQAAPPSLPAVG